ncbi:WD repeat-containing protein slp1 [Sphaceloma murrayae]|uniref:WD repeat-containing protein slp1 n=1 Tax=Sphaceloma murrayae TaxID=2082308 RepID=A0A2K1QSB5_9PEZI|nr:WD repeat-containing protein slp1 [Sphaceloma murrayae]
MAVPMPPPPLPLAGTASRKIKLRIQVHSEAVPPVTPTFGTLQRPKPRSFILVAQSSDTFRDVWLKAERKYSENYAEGRQSDWQIKKLTTGDDTEYDIDLRDLVGDHYGPDDDPSDTVVRIHVLPSSRGVSLPFNSHLRIPTNNRELLEVQGSDSRRRRVEQQRYGAALDELDPDQAVPSAEPIQDRQSTPPGLRLSGTNAKRSSPLYQQSEVDCHQHTNLHKQQPQPAYKDVYSQALPMPNHHQSHAGRARTDSHKPAHTDQQRVESTPESIDLAGFAEPALTRLAGANLQHAEAAGVELNIGEPVEPAHPQSPNVNYRQDSKGAKWTPEENRTLARALSQGLTPRQILDRRLITDRSLKSVQHKSRTMRDTNTSSQRDEVIEHQLQVWKQHCAQAQARGDPIPKRPSPQRIKATAKAPVVSSDPPPGSKQQERISIDTSSSSPARRPVVEIKRPSPLQMSQFAKEPDLAWQVGQDGKPEMLDESDGNASTTVIPASSARGKINTEQRQTTLAFPRVQKQAGAVTPRFKRRSTDTQKQEHREDSTKVDDASTNGSPYRTSSVPRQHFDHLAEAAGHSSHFQRLSQTRSPPSATPKRRGSHLRGSESSLEVSPAAPSAIYRYLSQTGTRPTARSAHSGRHMESNTSHLDASAEQLQKEIQAAGFRSSATSANKEMRYDHGNESDVEYEISHNSPDRLVSSQQSPSSRIRSMAKGFHRFGPFDPAYDSIPPSPDVAPMEISGDVKRANEEEALHRDERDQRAKEWIRRRKAPPADGAPLFDGRSRVIEIFSDEESDNESDTEEDDDDDDDDDNDEEVEDGHEHRDEDEELPMMPTHNLVGMIPSPLSNSSHEITNTQSTLGPLRPPFQSSGQLRHSQRSSSTQVMTQANRVAVPHLDHQQAAVVDNCESYSKLEDPRSPGRFQEDYTLAPIAEPSQSSSTEYYSVDEDPESESTVQEGCGFYTQNLVSSFTPTAPEPCIRLTGASDGPSRSSCKETRFSPADLTSPLMSGQLEGFDSFPAPPPSKKKRKRRSKQYSKLRKWRAWAEKAHEDCLREHAEKQAAQRREEFESRKRFAQALEHRERKYKRICGVKLSDHESDSTVDALLDSTSDESSDSEWMAKWEEERRKRTEQAVEASRIRQMGPRPAAREAE